MWAGLTPEEARGGGGGWKWRTGRGPRCSPRGSGPLPARRLRWERGKSRQLSLPRRGPQAGETMSEANCGIRFTKLIQIR